MRQIICIAHDIRSLHNVGSLFRTCDGLGVQQLILSGYTPYPQTSDDTRLPHETARLQRQLEKTALGAEKTVPWLHSDDILQTIASLREQGFSVVALEQTVNSVPLPDYKPPEKVAVLLGREVEGIDAGLLTACDETVEIPMFGTKESFNVVQAAAMTLYHIRFAK